MFTDNPRPTITEHGCLHRGISQSVGDVPPSTICTKIGECEGWRVWACKECGYIYFDQAPMEYDSTKRLPSFTLAEVLQSHNWATKSESTPVLIKSLEDLVNFYVKQGGYHLNEAIDRTQKELEKIATGTQYMSTRAVLVRTLMSYMVRYTASRQSAFAEVRHILSDIERDIDF